MSVGKWWGATLRRRAVAGFLGLAGLWPVVASAELVFAVSEGTSGGGASITGDNGVGKNGSGGGDGKDKDT